MSTGESNDDVAPASKPDPSEEVRELTHIIAAFAGPIPPPSLLEGYERVVPGAADRIIKMAEQQSQHRRQQEARALAAKIADAAAERREARIGQVFGLIIGVTALVSGVICILMSHEVSGTVLGGTGLVSLVSAFIIGRFAQRPPSTPASPSDSDKGQ